MVRFCTLFRISLVVAVLAGAASAPAGAAETRIVGGSDAPAGVYDAVANVAIAGVLGCSGTLVTPEWVLSAGHCGSVTGAAIGTPIGWPPGAVTVTLGTRNANGAGGTEYMVDRVKLPTPYLAVQGYDVSLLHLAKAATIAPIQVAGKGSQPLWAPGVVEIIAGFGVTSSGGDSPPIMQEARVPIVTDAYCATKYDTFEAQTQLCAGYPEGGIDTCQGDSGGPMFATDAAGALKVVGATSYGDGCAERDTPGVYARVSDTTLREWIRSVAGDAAIDDAVALPTTTQPSTPTEPVKTTTTPPSPTPAPAMTSAQSTPAPAAPGATPAPSGGKASTTAPQGCVPRAVTVRLKAKFAKRVRTAKVFVDGKRVGTLRGAASKVSFTLSARKTGSAVVKVVMTLKSGKRQTDTRRLRYCIGR